MWYADPAGAQEQCELRCANLTVRKGVNDLRLGIMAVSARLRQGTLRVLEGRCPNLLFEAGLYRYDDGPASAGRETPVDEYNHALAALRYLICTVDKGRLARPPRTPQGSVASAMPAPSAEDIERAEQERLRRAQREYLLAEGPHWIRLT
jgi:hypothetical protein